MEEKEKMQRHRYTEVRIKGKLWEVDLNNRQLICVEEPNVVREMLTIEEYEHFKSIVIGY
jgi:hypothetical protein